MPRAYRSPTRDAVAAATRRRIVEAAGTLFVRDGYAVLRDTSLFGTPHLLEQLFHFTESASRDGTWLRGNGHNARVLGIAVVGASLVVRSGDGERRIASGRSVQVRRGERIEMGACEGGLVAYFKRQID